MSETSGSVGGWFSSQTAGKSAFVAAVVFSILLWGALLFGPADANPPIGESVDAVVPDLVAAVDVQSAVADEWLASARLDLGDVAGVTSTSVDWLSSDLTAFYMSLDGATVERRSLDSVVADIRLVVADSAGVSVEEVEVAGRLVAEQSVAAAYGGSSTLLIILAVLLAAAAFVIDRRLGPLVALSLVGSTVFASVLSRRLIGPFDGTVASVGVPAALAALVTASLVCWRLARWFRSPQGSDGADLIRRSVSACCVDLVAVSFGLLVAGAIFSLLGSITSPLWAVLTGVALAGVWSAAITATGLAIATVGREFRDGADPLRPVVAALDGLRMVPSSAAVLGCLAALVAMSVFAFGGPSVELIDGTAVEGEAEGSVAAGGESLNELYRLGAGNPTEALVVTLNESSTTTIDAVATNIVSLAGVAWVDTAAVRYIGADQQAAVDGVSLLSPSVLNRPLGQPDDLDRSAVVVTSVPLAGAEGAKLLDHLGSLDAVSVSSPALSGLTTRGSGRLTLVVAGLLALFSGLATFAVSRDRTYGVITSVLALMLGLAGVGMYRLVSGAAASAELILVMVMVMTLFALWALEYARPPSQLGEREWHPGDGEATESGDVAGDGVIVVVAVAVVGSLLLALSAVVGSGPGIGRLGLGLALVTAVTGLAGMVVLGPALLGQSAVFHRLVRPVRMALHPEHPMVKASNPAGDDPASSRWTGIAGDLMEADFMLQKDPDAWREDDVVLKGTPIHDEVLLRQARMRAAGLRVAGSRPVMRRIDVVRHGRCPSVALTVDHPQRKLVADDGTVVGVRAPERKSMVVWLADAGDGRFVVAEAVETGTYPLDRVDEIRLDSTDSVIGLADATAVPAVGDKGAVG